LTSQRTGAWALASFTIAVVAVTMLVPRIHQPLSYHNFADQRGWLGIPNFGNVVSNLLFAIAGVWGLLFLCRQHGREIFVDPRERLAYLLVFLGLLLTALGSSYYHLAADNSRLVWDRLPMTIAFMALASAMIAERISVPAGSYMLPILILIGMGSVVWWWHTEQICAGDLRFYAAVQVYAVLVLPLMLLLPPRYSRSSDFVVIFGLYITAKILETLDRQIFAFDRHTISGHTLKHLAAGAAGFWILRMLQKRRPLQS